MIEAISPYISSTALGYILVFLSAGMFVGGVMLFKAAATNLAKGFAQSDLSEESLGDDFSFELDVPSAEAERAKQALVSRLISEDVAELGGREVTKLTLRRPYARRTFGIVKEAAQEVTANPLVDVPVTYKDDKFVFSTLAKQAAEADTKK